MSIKEKIKDLNFVEVVDLIIYQPLLTQQNIQ